jgi:hypothetical protein
MAVFFCHRIETTGEHNILVPVGFDTSREKLAGLLNQRF